MKLNTIASLSLSNFMLLVVVLTPSPCLAVKPVFDINGYENLLWGATLGMVQAKYPAGIKRVTGDRADFPNSQSYQVKYRTGLIEERDFIFYQGKFAKVAVTYRVTELLK